MTSKIVLLILLVYHSQQHVLTATTSEAAELQQQNALLDPTLTPNTSSNQSCGDFNLYKNIFEEMNSQNQPLIQVFYNRVIQKLYENMTSTELFQQLWQIYKKCDPSTYVTMVRAQLSLFWLHNMNEYTDNDYVLMAANGFYKIKSNPLYAKLNRRTKMLFERALKSLPNSLHYLFGHREFCLLNKMHGEMMYQTDGNEFVKNPEIRFGFTWHLMKDYSDDTGLIVPIFEETNFTLNDGENEEFAEDSEVVYNLNVALYSKNFKNFYSRWPFYDQKIGGNMSVMPQQVLQQEYHIWSVHLIDDDSLVFRQNDYLMCATTFYDNKRRYVFALRNKTMDDAECHWSAGKCDRR